MDNIKIIVSKKGIRIGHLNVISLIPVAYDVAQLITSYEVDTLTLWLDETIVDAEVCPPDYLQEG